MEEGKPGAGGLSGADGVPGLPLLPGFREMALRRMSADRRRLVADLTAQRRAAGLSQTEVAARMGTSQSAVARLETGDADVRVSTLERYAAAIGSQLAWQARVRPGEDAAGPPGADPVGPGLRGPGLREPGFAGPGLREPELTSPGNPRAGQPGTGQGQEYR
jgi:DNA-binding Xre family transcriptional regulator